MAKATKTAKELETMIMREARASGKCHDLLSVTVLGSDSHTNWKIGTASSNQDNLISGECRTALDMIVARLKTMYDLAGS
jgi:hypothetical protein